MAKKFRNNRKGIIRVSCAKTPKTTSTKVFPHFKALAAAALVTLASNGVYAMTVDEAMNKKPAPVPTLDYLHSNNVMTPPEQDADGNDIAGSEKVYPESGYTMTEITPENPADPGENVIRKYEIKEVTRYYDKTTGAPVAEPTEAGIAAGEYKVVQEKDLVPHYYRVGLKQTEYGNKDSYSEVKYYNWSKDSNGNNILTEGTQAAGENSIKYYVDNTRPVMTGFIETDQGGRDIEGNFIGLFGRAIYNNGSIESITGDFIGNYTRERGGAIYNSWGPIGDITGSFVSNRVVDGAYGGSSYIGPTYGGAIYNYYGSIESITADFIGNYAESSESAYGGAIYNNNGEIGDIAGDFVGNYASAGIEASGGAINNSARIYSSFPTAPVIGNITGNFIGNAVYTNSSPTTVLAATAKGGAISNSAVGYSSSTKDVIATIGDITGDFIGNTAYTSGLRTITAYGGAISNSADKYSKAIIGDITGDFIGNKASVAAFSGGLEYETDSNVYGGAISNYTDGSYANATIGNITGDFIGNTALANTSSNWTESNFNPDSTVRSNAEASAYGGAIFNQGQIGEVLGDFIGNKALSVSSSKSTSDSLKSYSNTYSYTYGGAIYNRGQLGKITGNFIGNTASSSSTSNSTSNTGANAYADAYAYGGAIYNRGTIDGIKGNFIGNYTSALSSATASSESNSYAYTYSQSQGGAIYNRSTINGLEGDFIGNYSFASAFTGSRTDASGGAIYNLGTINGITGNFIGNYASVSGSGSASGGAIYNGSKIDNMTGDFIGNYATATGSGSAQGGAIYSAGYSNSIGDITGDFIGNYVSASGSGSAYGGAIVLSGSNHFAAFRVGTISGNFIGNSVQSSSNAAGGAIYNYGSLIKGIENSTFKDNHAIGSAEAYGGAISMHFMQATLPPAASTMFLNVKNSIFIDNYAKADTFAAGGALHYNNYQGNVQSTDLTNVDFINNHAEAANGEAKGGAVYTNKSMNFTAKDGYQSVFSGNYTESAGVRDDNAIYVDSPYATLNFTMENGGKFLLQDNIDGEKGYDVNIQGDDINNTTFYLHNDIRNADVTIRNTTLNTINNKTHAYNFDTFYMSDDINMAVDVDLANQEMDRVTAGSYEIQTGVTSPPLVKTDTLYVTGMNMISDAPEGRDITEIFFAEQGLKDHVVNGAAELPQKEFQTTAYTPIFKYNVKYDNRDDGGYFMFTKGDRIFVEPEVPGGGTSTIPSGNPSDAFNPAVLSSPVAAQAGANATMNQTFNYAFQNADNFMNIPYLERVAMKYENQYALSPTGDATDVGTFSPLFTKQNTSSVWVKPYASFENIPLKNGPKVSNITYGTLIGFDSEMQHLKRGWDRVWTGYIGYNGASQRYSGVDSTQNGGLVGGTMTLYKGNFFNATTLSAGASVANNQTMYGNEDFAMLLAGIGNKTGYNFEFKNGRLILQPNMLISYTFVNTFDYTNAAGVRIDSKPLNAIQLAPGVKVIANLEGGWQPYVGVNMVWNLLDKSNVHANDVKLPEMSVKPYVQYGVGIQKRIKDKYMAFGQAMIQNGGRNGVSLTAGFRWALGKEGKPIEKVTTPQPRIGNAGQTGLVTRHFGQTVSDKKGGKLSASQPGARKILKQLTPEQRTALGGKSYGTTRTVNKGVLKQL